ncbi:MAG: GNAT family N-acetyltransferase [bacterium]
MNNNPSSLTVKIIISTTPIEEIIELSYLSGPSDNKHYQKIMAGFIANSLSASPDLDLGIVYGLYEGENLIASARIKQDEYTSTAVSIEYVAVKPEYRGKGLGATFMKGLFKEIKERWGKKIVMLATGESRPFYDKIGMSLLGEMTNKDEGSRFYMYEWLD